MAFPDDATKKAARRQVDLGRGVQTFLNFMPAASLEMLYVGHRDGYGMQPNRDIGLFEELMSYIALAHRQHRHGVRLSLFGPQ